MVQSQRLTPPTVELLCFKGCSIVEHVLGIGFHAEFGERKSLHIERSGPLGQANLRLHSIPQRQFWLTDHQKIKQFYEPYMEYMHDLDRFEKSAGNQSVDNAELMHYIGFPSLRKIMPREKQGFDIVI
nr:hypothetical protein Iba_chr04aCG17140 [Ipomoea batatas]